MNRRQTDDLVLLTTVYPPEDIFIEGVLETAGIKVFKKREAIAPVEGITFGPLAEIGIFVLASDEKRARETLSSALSGGAGEESPRL